MRQRSQRPGASTRPSKKSTTPRPASVGSLVAGLNDAQREAVLTTKGPLLVLAGAGSGKTRVITHRIAHLVREEGVRPETICAVSFTNKAAEEMAERMVPLVGSEQARALWLSTFHGLGVRFLQEEAATILGEERGRARFSIFDQGDAVGLVKEIVKREGIADRKLDLYAVHARISLWKNRGWAPGEVRANSGIEYDAVALEVYPHYEAALRSMRAFDFDDLVLVPARALRDKPELRAKWQGRFRYLMVDEFQDTNAIQLDVVKLLAPSSPGSAVKNVCVVGDDDQSIYGWRGADVGNILEFEHTFPGTKVVKLETNYRSHQPILSVANAAIARAGGKRHGKTLRAHKLGGAKVRLCTLGTLEQEAKFVAKEIRSLRGESMRAGDIAVLYRSNLQARAIEEELRVEGIPYRLVGGTQFFEKKEVKDALAYLRVVANPRDELSLRRILNYPSRGIGDTTVERLERWAKAHRHTFAYVALEQLPRDGGHRLDVPDGACDGARKLSDAIERARASIGTAPLSTIARQLFDDTGLRRELEDGGKEEGPAKEGERGPGKRIRWENVEFLMRALDRYEAIPSETRPSLATFLARLTIRRDEEGEVEPGDEVTLSSLHSSKGLEWPVVFLIGLNEGTLPHLRTIDPKASEAAPTDVEEERRLFYVGVTRARERLYLTRFQRKELRGSEKPMTPSRFLEGLPEDDVEAYERDDDAPASHQDSAAFAKAFLAKLRGEA
jgi:DNA helicase-2/ATP-dependent DNA helicase PcrA